MNSCTVRNMYELNDTEKELFPKRRVSQFWDKCGNNFIVSALSLLLYNVNLVGSVLRLLFQHYKNSGSFLIGVC